VEFKFEHKIGNRKVSQREWGKHLFEDEPRRIMREHMEGIAAKARAVVCPEHGPGGVTASVIPSGDSYAVHTECCCEAAAALVRSLGDGGSSSLLETRNSLI
jgi:hypothetical protein